MTVKVWSVRGGRVQQFEHAGQRCAGGSTPRCMTQTAKDLDKVGVWCSHALCMHTQRAALQATFV